MPNEYAYFDPVASGSTTQNTPPSTIDYTAWDYDTIKRRLSQIAQAHYGDSYNNLTEQDFGVVLMEYMAAISDWTSYKLDYYINESFLSTAILEKSIRRHARRVGYRVRPRMPARYDFTLTVEEPYSVDVTIRPGLRLYTNGKDAAPLSVEIYLADSAGNPLYDQEIVLPAGLITLDNLIGIEGILRSRDTRGNGTTNQVFPINDTKVLPTSIRMWVDNQEWSEVEALADHGPELVFRVDQDDRTNKTYVITGDGIHGAVVPSGSGVVIQYRTGGGERGNLPAGFIKVSQSVLIPGTNTSAPLTFINRTRGRGGDNGETGEDIRLALPAWYRTQDRLVTIDDYTTYADSYYSSESGRVAKARAYVGHAACSANIILIYVLEYVSSSEVASPSDKLLADLLLAIDQKKIATDEICLKAGHPVSIDLRIYAQSVRANYPKKSDIESKIRQALERFFDLRQWTFGKAFDRLNILRWLGSITEVDNFDVTATMDPGYEIVNGVYQARPWELIRPRTLEITIDFTS